MQQFDRFPVGGNQIKPSSGNHQGFWQAQNPVRGRVTVVVIAKQPCVDAAVP
jgi:hypothetical protein